jgi:hypothetical protein
MRFAILYCVVAAVVCLFACAGSADAAERSTKAPIVCDGDTCATIQQCGCSGGSCRAANGGPVRRFMARGPIRRAIGNFRPFRNFRPFGGRFRR